MQQHLSGRARKPVPRIFVVVLFFDLCRRHVCKCKPVLASVLPSWPRARRPVAPWSPTGWSMNAEMLSASLSKSCENIHACRVACCAFLAFCFVCVRLSTAPQASASAFLFVAKFKSTPPRAALTKNSLPCLAAPAAGLLIRSESPPRPPSTIKGGRGTARVAHGGKRQKPSRPARRSKPRLPLSP
eukprot:scaffold48870_cov270-Isochrysis_galbana.AAC.2